MTAHSVVPWDQNRYLGASSWAKGQQCCHSALCLSPCCCFWWLPGLLSFDFLSLLDFQCLFLVWTLLFYLLINQLPRFLPTPEIWTLSLVMTQFLPDYSFCSTLSALWLRKVPRDPCWCQAVVYRFKFLSFPLSELSVPHSTKWKEVVEEEQGLIGNWTDRPTLFALEGQWPECFPHCLREPTKHLIHPITSRSKGWWILKLYGSGLKYKCSSLGLS